MTHKKHVTSSFRRHLEGWQAGGIAVVVAGVGVLLGAPRAVTPDEVPLPIVDPRGLAATERATTAGAALLTNASEEEKSGPTYDLRALGAALRAFGAADVAGDKEKLSLARQRITEAVGKVDARHLAALEAYEERVFQRELAAWEVTGAASTELGEVGGDFLSLAIRSGWVREPHALLCDDVVRGALFKRRFVEVTGRHDPELGASLDESRALYGFWLRFPPPSTGASLPSSDPHLAQLDVDRWRLHKVEELAVIDPAYPASLARGVLLYRLGDPRAAARAFREHLAAHPDGPYTLRARNWLAAAQGLANEG